MVGAADDDIGSIVDEKGIDILDMYVYGCWQKSEQL